jgi:RNA polymerase sigma-70 factor (ECF subfamily)
VLDPLRQALGLKQAAAANDGQLLGAFVARRDEAAFAALVRRHGPMVLGVCRRVLGHAADAEDTFQAVFLVLARKAGSLAACPVLAAWLHGVARRTALKAKTARARRRVVEAALAQPAVQAADHHHSRLPLLDDEVARLPEKYRLPVVVCDLEGKTRREAAAQLGWPEGTVAGRLARGRALLGKRLLRGAQALGAALPGALLPSSAEAAVPPNLTQATVRTACRPAAGGAADQAVVSGPAVSLARGVLRSMFWKRVRVAVTCVLLCAGLGLAGALTLQAALGGGVMPGRGAAPEFHVPGQPAPNAAPAAQGPTDPLAIRGTWRVHAASANGKHLPRETSTDQVWVITGETITVFYDDATTDQWTYKLDPAAKPRAIDCKALTGFRADGVAVGIYELRGDSLRVCLSWGQPPQRPEEFDLGEDRGRRVFELQRVARNAGQPDRGVQHLQALADWHRTFPHLPRTALKVELSPATKVDRTKGGLTLRLKITNDSAKDLEAVLAPEWHGGLWPTTGLSASVTPAKANHVRPFHPLFLAGERDGKAAGKTTIAAGKSVEVETRVDWPGTGSVPTEPLIHPGQPGTYLVRVVLVFEAGGFEQFVTSAVTVVELLPAANDARRQ